MIRILIISLLSTLSACASTVPTTQVEAKPNIEQMAKTSFDSTIEKRSTTRRQTRKAFQCVDGGTEINTRDIPAIDISFIEADIREALLELSMLTEIPIVADDSVQGIVSATLLGKDLSTALKIVLSPGNFAFKKYEDFIFVGSQYPGSPSLTLLSSTCRYSPMHSEVAELVPMLSPLEQEFVQINTEANIISITAPPMMQEKLKHSLELLDEPRDQILLEVSIVEVNREVFDILGINWGSLNIIEEGLDVALTAQLLDKLGGNQNNYNYVGNGGLNHNSMNRFKDSIGVLKNRGDADIKAMPSIVTLDGKEATFNSTETIWLPQFAEGGSSKMKGLVYGVNIKLIPHIRSNNTIRLNIIDASVSDLTTSASGEPILVSHTVSNTVDISDGDIVVLGGLVQKKNKFSEAKVPVLSGIPGIKKLFSQEITEMKETEVLIVIRPSITG